MPIKSKKVDLFPQRNFDGVDNFFNKHGVSVEDCGTFVTFCAYGLALFHLAPESYVIPVLMALLGCIVVYVRNKSLEVKTGYSCGITFVNAARSVELNQKD